jgi:hypothetical protein
MHASARAFLSQIIDYAGLFPPAKLPLDESIRNYVDAGSNSPHRWMLRNFVCPTVQLSALAGATSSPVAVAALGAAVTQVNAFAPQLEADMRLVEDYRAAQPNAKVPSYEVALPAGLTASELGDAIERFVQALKSHRLRGFLEIPMSPSWEADVSNLCQAIDAWRTGMKLQRTDKWLGLKLRCGGLTPEAFPSDAQVAHFIERCRETNVRWKATAGLHHPRRHWDESLKVWHHGFLNVFLAGVLARTQMSWPNLAEILADRQLSDLRFERNRLVWKFWECDVDEITEARSEFATSFGSCSFDEPTADLFAMGPPQNLG